MDIASLYKVFLNSKGVSTDTRTIRPGEVYFALRGPNFDGNRFAEQALAAGALAVVVDDPLIKPSGRHFVVEDGLTALQQLARHHRQQMKAQVVAITGSNGKTTSKELIQAVLSTTFNTLASEGNLNNHIGVPLTLLRLRREHEFAIIEMGANHQGEIASLCEIAEPQFGIVTNVGKAHLEGFGGLEGVIKAKRELFDYLARNNGTIFINSSEDHLKDMASAVESQVSYGTDASCDFQAVLTNATPTVQLSIRDSKIKTQLTGTYNFHNALLAATVGLYFEVMAERVVSAIESYVPHNNRSQVLKQGSNTIILDAYNANPTSVEAALENLKDIEAKHRVAILGEMLELGEYANAEHDRIAQLAVTIADQVVLVGSEYAHARHKGALHFDDLRTCQEWYAQQGFQDSVILIKGSRKVALERLVAESTPRQTSPLP